MDLQKAVTQILAAAEDSKQATLAATEAARAATTAANASTAAANASTAAVHQLSLDFQTLRRDFKVLWRRVRGEGDPPPDGDPSAAPAEVPGEPSIEEQLDRAHELGSQANLEVAALEGRVIGYLATVKSEVMNELRKQSKDAGVDRSGWAYLLRTKQGKATLATVSAVIVTLVTTIVGAVRGPAPLPAPAPAPTIIYAPAPPASR